VKIAQGISPCGAFILHISYFDQIWVKISILGVQHPCRCTDGGEIWHGGRDQSPPPCQISPPSVQRVAPAGRKTSKSASDKLNTGRLALRAMLPVIMDEIFYKTTDSPPRQLETISRGRANHRSSNIFVLWPRTLTYKSKLTTTFELVKWTTCQIFRSKVI